MRIALTSDLHIEHHPEVIPLVAARLHALAPDVAVIAGDLSHDMKAVEAALTELARAVPVLTFVPGNHDLWTRANEPSSRERYLELLPALVRRAGAHPLTDETLRIGNFAIVGETGWFDFTLRNRSLDDTFTMKHYRAGAWGRLQWADRLHVRFASDDGLPLDDEGLTAWMIARLESKLAATAAGPAIVVTHHLPFAALVVERGEAPWDFLNGFIGSARLGDAIAAFPNVTLALAGHTHFARRATVEKGAGSIDCVVSPVGYPREYRSHGDLAERVAARVTLIELDELGRQLPSRGA